MTEEINFPQCPTFLRGTVIAIDLITVIFSLIVIAVAVSKGTLSADAAVILEEYPNLAGLLNVGVKTRIRWTVWVITGGLSFADGAYIILSNVRLIVGEIVFAFRSIAERLASGAMPAVDCPVVSPYAPNVVLIGLLVFFLDGIVGLFTPEFIDTNLMSAALILPDVTPHFFYGATAGVFVDAEGGLRGCVSGSFMHGLLITFLPAICISVVGSLNFANYTFSDADLSWVGIVFGNIAQAIQGVGLLGVYVVVFLVPIVYNYVAPKKAKKAE